MSVLPVRPRRGRFDDAAFDGSALHGIGAEQIVEQRAVRNQRLAHFFGRRLATRIALCDCGSGAVVVEHARVLDGEIVHRCAVSSTG
ncbi:hypothetical protein [Vulcanimicrobium alpinum]|uniref:hypothetical protein n=1 Tax=Vulcanimicrobium alpinum TaxID=3016050 RepID=UPI00295E6F0A|nr:hypothetical protein [Vulcanimicrobium alpinum]